MNTDNLQLMNEKYKQDFNTALDIYEKNYSHLELIEFLKNGSVAQKQAAVIKLDGIFDKSEAKIFMNNLTGCDGKIREAVSFRLKEFINNNSEYYEEFYSIFLDAVIDINGNICRNVLDAIEAMKNNENFTEKFCEDLVKNTLELANKAKDFDLQDGKYKINKEIFKLYWYMEAMYRFSRFIEKDILLKILMLAKQVQDYTIREKAAKILSNLADSEFDSLKSEFAKDCNYYVLKALKSSCS